MAVVVLSNKFSWDEKTVITCGCGWPAPATLMASNRTGGDAHAGLTPLPGRLNLPTSAATGKHFHAAVDANQVNRPN